ncbi:MAG: hypothetical protein M3P94_06965 [Chloroflexota bacterium]|nr:hypothetical protein [Chloroflexota bacterium]
MHDKDRLALGQACMLALKGLKTYNLLVPHDGNPHKVVADVLAVMNGKGERDDLAEQFRNIAARKAMFDAMIDGLQIKHGPLIAASHSLGAVMALKFQDPNAALLKVSESVTAMSKSLTVERV